MGVDGFRVDAVWPLSKDPDFADDPWNSEFDGPDDSFGRFIHSKCKCGPNLASHLKDMTDVVASYEDRFMIFEYYSDERLGDTNAQLYQLYHIDPTVSAPFYFDCLNMPWSADHFARSLDSFCSGLKDGDVMVPCFSNHDQPRMVSRFGQLQARAVAVLQMTLPGLPTMYYGDELGMENVDISLDQTHDLTGEMGGRDPERTPMQWSPEEFAGFSSVKPWLPTMPEFEGRNVESELGEETSYLSLYRELLKMRRDSETLRRGSFEKLDQSNGYVLAFARHLREESIIIAMNFSDQFAGVDIPEGYQAHISSYADSSRDAELRPYEAKVFFKI